MKRFTKIIFGGSVLLVAALGFVWLSLSGHGSSALEKWIGSQIISVIDSYLTPKVAFKRLNYQAPYTVIVDHLTFTDSKEKIIAIDRLHVELAEIPSQGRPILIKEIHLENPHLAFISAGSGLGLVGWSHFVREQAIREPQSVPKETRLSDVLAIRKLSIKNGEVIYDPRGGQKSMTIPGINLSLETPPSKTEPGWYGLAGAFKKEPFLNVDFDGRINLDTAILEFKKLLFRVALADGQYSALPPQIQDVVKTHEMKGDLQIAANGSLTLSDIAGANLRIRAMLRHASMSFERNVWPIHTLDIDAELRQSVLHVWANLSALGGTVDARAILGLSSDQLLEADWKVAGIRLEETLRTELRGETTRTGSLATTGKVTARLTQLPQSLGGEGRVDLTDARLVDIPIMRELLALLNKTPLGKLAPSDRASLDFQLRPDHVQLNDLKVICSLMAVTGAGKIYFDKRLDLLLNAGVLERLESALGQAGKLLGAITNKAVAYEVTGVMGEPKVRVKPLGL